MGRTQSRTRPWLAAVLGVAVTGLGHLYLRRWMRALGWLLAVFATGTLFVSDAALQAFATGERFPIVELLPVVAVSTLSVVDAYLLAVSKRFGAEYDDEDRTVCPDCGRPADANLDFCQWCSTRLVDRGADAETDRGSR